MAKGRPRKTGKRTPKGDRPSRAGKSHARDYGNIRVIERHSRFQHFIDDKGLVFEGTSAGRLWIVGAFDGFDFDPQVLRDCLLSYGRAYWGELPCSSGVANYLQENRRGYDGGEHTDPDPAGEWFKAMDNLLRSAGHESRIAVHNVAVDPHFFPDEDSPWVGRIINSRVKQKRELLAKQGSVPSTLSICGMLACDSDWAMLRLLCLGSLALARGKTGTSGFENRSAA